MLKKNYVRVIVLAIMLVLLSVMGTFAVSAAETDYGTAGVITESERAPEQGDHSNWLTIQSKDAGVRVVNNEGRELVAVDNFGGIYLNGDVYLNSKLLNPDAFQLGNGFLYLLLIVSLGLNIVNLIKIRRMKK